MSLNKYFVSNDVENFINVYSHVLYMESIDVNSNSIKALSFRCSNLCVVSIPSLKSVF